MGIDHVQFANAEPGQRGGLLAERGDKRCAQRKADDDAHGNAGAGEHTDGGGGPDGVDHGAGKAVANGLIAEAFNLIAGGIGLEQGVVNDRSQRLPICQGGAGEGR